MHLKDYKTYKLLLEDFLDDDAEDIAVSSETNDITKEDVQKTYPFFVIFDLKWKNTFTKGNEIIPLKKIYRRLESAMVSSGLFLANTHFIQVKLKNDTNCQGNPDPVIYTPNTMPETFEGKNVLIPDHYYYRKSDTVQMLFKFIIPGLKKCSFDKFVQKIRKLSILMRSIVQQRNNFGGGSVAFRRNLGEEGESSKERIGREYNFSSFYTTQFDEQESVYKALIAETENDPSVINGNGKYRLIVYKQSDLKQISKDAAKKSKDYGFKAKFCRVKQPSDIQVMQPQNDAESVMFSSFIIEPLEEKGTLDVVQIESWLINEIIYRIDIDFLDIFNLGFALKCMCKITNNHLEEVMNEYKEKNHNEKSVPNDQKKFRYNIGARREFFTNQTQQFDKQTYNYRARVGRYEHFWRTDVGIILGDKNGEVSKSYKVFTSPMHPWNDLIKEMRNPNSDLWKQMR